MDSAEDIRAHIEDILSSATRHDHEALQKFLNVYNFPGCTAVDVQDPVTGRCALHMAIAFCEEKALRIPSHELNASNPDEDKASETVRLLLENGAIWNQLDGHDETPGCLAHRLGLHQVYQLMVDAGVRAELLLNRLDGYEQLDDSDLEDSGEPAAADTNENPSGMESSESIVPLIETFTDTSSSEPLANVDVSSADYLSSVLSFDKDKLLDSQNNGVMMAWERDIMHQSATRTIDRSGLKVLNIGAGMLIYDTYVQEMGENRPSEHHIVEAHPGVLSEMRKTGWMERSGVTVHEGKWQDVLPALVAEGHTFDSIYYDTFAESYADFKDFFSEEVIGLLNQDGKWSFFNGMGADRQISYDVYQKVVEMDLFEAGFDVEWYDMDIPTLDQEWEGVKRKYWNIDSYRLPVCSFMS